jgi:hypothetical protein
MDFRKGGVKRKTESMIRRSLKAETAYYIDMSSFVGGIADYFEARAGRELDRTEADALRLAAYRETLPELIACFEEMARDWNQRLEGKAPDFSRQRQNAVHVVDRILFLTEI